MRTVAVGFFVAALQAAASAAGAIDEPLRATLLQMARDDQAAIRPSVEGDFERSHELISKNHELIRKIVDAHGWPRISLVGEDGASAAWLVVQHMDMDVEFQRRCLSLMQQAFAEGEVRSRDLAYLTDRVLTHEGKPQMYGTQGRGVLSKGDEARIDRNRAAIGLEPWRIAVEKRKKDYEKGYGGSVAD